MHKVREQLYSSCAAGSMNENMCSFKGGAQEKGKTQMKLSLPSKLVGKTSLGPSYFVL
jgi:hypothetical protein